MTTQRELDEDERNARNDPTYDWVPMEDCRCGHPLEDHLTHGSVCAIFTCRCTRYLEAPDD